MPLDRRTFLISTVASLAVRPSVANATVPIPIVDCLVHLWDLTRPQGTPTLTQQTLDSENFKKYHFDKKRMLPDVYRKDIARPEVVGIIAVEASPWVEDNLWLLEACADDTIMVGAIGNLKPEAREFPEYLERYHANSLFLGIRPRDTGYNIVEQSANPAFLSGLKLLAQAGLVLEVAGPEDAVLQTALRISDAVPTLKLVVTHFNAFVAPHEAGPASEATLREVQQRPQLYGKIGIAPGASGEVSPHLADHKVFLDRVWALYGEDRVVGNTFFKGFPSVELLHKYCASISHGAADKFFWRNSIKVYHWVHRAPDQPRAA